MSLKDDKQNVFGSVMSVSDVIMPFMRGIVLQGDTQQTASGPADIVLRCVKSRLRKILHYVCDQYPWQLLVWSVLSHKMIHIATQVCAYVE